MELQQLRYLRAVVRLGSVTRAAEAEHVAQPSVSKQLRLVEREIGVPLFHRVGRRLVPTDAALELANCADRVLEDLAVTTATLGEHAGGPQRLAICATETIADHLLPRPLAALLARWPTLRASVEMLGADDAVNRVLDDRADFAIVPLPVVDSRLEVQPLFTEDVLLALPPGHPFAQHAEVPLDAVLAAPELLLPMRGHGLRATVEAAATDRGVALASRLELRSQQALLAMVALGAGIAFAPSLVLAAHTEVAIRPTAPSLRREVGWLRRKGRYLPAAAFELLDRMRSA